jgi:hypothetical protein
LGESVVTVGGGHGGGESEILQMALKCMLKIAMLFTHGVGVSEKSSSKCLCAIDKSASKIISPAKLEH